MFKKINVYFFGVEEIPVSDTIFFYGQYVVGLIGMLIAWLVR